MCPKSVCLRKSLMLNFLSLSEKKKLHIEYILHPKQVYWYSTLATLWDHKYCLVLRDHVLSCVKTTFCTKQREYYSISRREQNSKKSANLFENFSGLLLQIPSFGNSKLFPSFFALFFLLYKSSTTYLIHSYITPQK